jgi:hypothetical protein
LAGQIPGAKYIEYPDGDHAFWTGDSEALVGDIEEFITGHHESPHEELERVLPTVLFTDIVDSTRRAAGRPALAAAAGRPRPACKAGHRETSRWFN